MSNKNCKDHIVCMLAITDNIAVIKTDVSWIKDNIKTAVESKRWLIGTAIAVVALAIAVFKG